ncbi:serine/threonine-protein kinase [Streptomyces sp. ISL-100]|uniref:serine/threonine-protein kinase n=1 Tax=Streptomyces sp. ISL-100 TaxID=2819173 RepID=UPI001BE960E9|nr:serine/threonine-protein kinase [Streptomyces sp. ISL-100]MBT2394581.1 serine/threonine protein kinase [Streptomyces sp. ISL-100]
MATGENERLAGRYRVVEQLGRGGMGVVWRAVDEVLGREVAVKELRTYNDSSGPELDGLRIRMQREARAAARVRHPGVIAVHDVTEHNGRPVIVMELVDGPSLDDVLRERGLLDPREAASIGARVLEALGAAHAVGVLHRDVKPGNVLLDRDSGRVVLTDFGIAAMDDPGDGSTTHLTRSGELVGSLDYLAPERAQGQEPGPASDVWALGATLYAAVEGGSPFRRTSTWSTLTAIVQDPLPEPRRAGPLGPVLQQLMSKDPAQRPDAQEAARLLAAVAAGEDTAALGGVPQGGVSQGGPYGGAHREPTVRDVLPHQPEGFGPAVSRQPAQSAPAGPVAASAPAHSPAPAPERRPGRGRTALVAAGVAAVLLAGGGVTYVLNDRTEQTSGGLAKGAEEEAASPSGLDRMPAGSEPAATKKPAASKSTDQGPEKTSRPDAKPPAGDGDGGKDSAGSDGGSDDGASGTSGSTGGADTSGGAGDSGGAATGGSAGGGSTTTTSGGGSGPGEPAPEPACHSIGAGKYNCTVWETAASYTASGAEVGVLNAGTNYFYCQQNLGRRETYGQWTNVWWAKTDDDRGNTNVFVSDVYIKGGNNDEPVPGLPVC